MEIYIKTITGKTITVPYDYNKTIGEVKEFIWEKTNILPSLQLIVFAGRILTNNHQTLSQWNIQRETNLHMISLPATKFTHNIIFNSNHEYSKLTVSLYSSSLIEDIKFQIQDKTGIPCDWIRVYHDCRELGDEEALISLPILPSKIYSPSQTLIFLRHIPPLI